MRLTFVTTNKGKFAEAREVLAPLGIDLAQDAGGYPELQADMLAEVARFGAEQVARRVKPPFILEDAGLFVDALGGFPGVYSAYALRTLGCRGILTLLEGTEDRRAHFATVLAYHDGARVRLFDGRVDGALAREERSKGHGFGFDPIFVPDGHARTFAEMSEAEKATLSHRGRALAAFADDLGR